MLAPSGHFLGKSGYAIDNWHGKHSFNLLTILSHPKFRGMQWGMTKLIHDPNAGMDRLLEIMRVYAIPNAGVHGISNKISTLSPHIRSKKPEVADAIEQKNWGELKSELGDLLLQTVYHTQMATEEGFLV